MRKENLELKMCWQILNYVNFVSGSLNLCRESHTIKYAFISIVYNVGLINIISSSPPIDKDWFVKMI
jgi:hypothetical protein